MKDLAESEVALSSGRNAVDEALGGWEGEDPGKRYYHERPEHFLEYSIRSKKQAYAEADSAFDVEAVLDALAITQASIGLGTTFIPVLSEIGSLASNLSEVFHTATLAEVTAPIIEAAPSGPETLLAGLSAYLVLLAKKTYFATKAEKDFKYNEYVKARAIQRVAEEDNGIDAAELLSAFIMTFDTRPFDKIEGTKRSLNYYKPKVSILPIEPEYRELVEAAEERIREEDRFAAQEASFYERYPKKIAKNLKEGAKKAATSMTVEFGKTAKRTWQATKISWDLSWRDRKRYKAISEATTWLEQKMSVRTLKAHIAITAHPEDRKRGEERSNGITAQEVGDFYPKDYFTIRQVEGERIRSIRENVAQQFDTSDGFKYANTFMAVNGIFAGTAFFGGGDPEIIMGTLYAVNVVMNVPPMLSIASGLVRQHRRYIGTAEKVMESHDDLRSHLDYTSATIEAARKAAAEAADFPANDQ